MPDTKPAMVAWFQPHPGDRVVDAGAHLGLHALRAAQLGAEVLAIEPHPATYALLRANLEANRLGRVATQQVALGARTGSAELLDAGPSSSVSSLIPHWPDRFRAGVSREVPVPVTTLDAVCPPAGFDAVDWLLIDAEGSEAEILEGGSRTLAHTRVAILEVAAGENEARCERLLGEAGLAVIERQAQPTANYYWRAERPGPVPRA
jgi:FkbM family methyltransferase